jgi:hypothetical protein
MTDELPIRSHPEIGFDQVHTRGNRQFKGWARILGSEVGSTSVRH